MTTPRTLYANLDFEARLERVLRPAGPPASLPDSALATIAAAGTLMRVLADPEDRLWLPAPFDAGRIPETLGIPRPRLLEGDPAGLEGPVLAWGASPLASADPSPAPSGSLALHEELWRLPASPVEIAARVHHRSFLLETAREMELDLPGADLIRQPGDLDPGLEQLCAVSGSREWVLKAPFSAAGRTRIFGSGARPTAATRKRVARLLRRHGILLLEPWLQRIADFGACALVTGDGVRRAAVHRLHTDSAGRFLGITVSGDPERAPGLRDEEARMLLEVTRGVGERLDSGGYRGPFGIDAWRHRTADGKSRLHPLGEINARMTFGLLARGLMDRFVRPARGGARPERSTTMTLRLGAPDRGLASRPDRFPCLLRPTPDHAYGAWIDLDEADPGTGPAPGGSDCG